MAEIATPTTILFIFTTVLTLWGFHWAIKSSKVLWGLLVWMTLVGILGIQGFYTVENAIPPRFVFLLGPGILLALFLFLTKKGSFFNHNLKVLTLLHTIRIPVEIVLFYVFLDGLIPKIMTFEGYNFDILSGISAPIMYYVVFVKKWMGTKALLIWNVVCLGLLLNILTIAFLSARTPIQQLAFDQPNIGVAYFPLVWLPAVIVPIVLYSHLASIRQILFLNSKN